MIPYLLLKIGSNSKKLKFHVWKRLWAPKIITNTYFTSFQANWHQNSSDLLLKEHLQQLPWWSDFAEIQPKFAQQIETKTHEVWRLYGKFFKSDYSKTINQALFVT